MTSTWGKSEISFYFFFLFLFEIRSFETVECLRIVKDFGCDINQEKHITLHLPLWQFVCFLRLLSHTSYLTKLINPLVRQMHNFWEAQALKNGDCNYYYHPCAFVEAYINYFQRVLLTLKWSSKLYVIDFLCFVN